MIQPCWNNLYFHNSFAYSFYFGLKGRGIRKTCVGRGLGALGHQEKSFYFYFSGACKYVCATWESHCWSKLNAELSLFYSFCFSITLLFVGKKNSSLFPVVRFLSVGSPVQPGRRHLVSPTSRLHLNMTNSSLIHLYSTSNNNMPV